MVRQRPLLIVPPWINRFYILDLQPKNSFLKWAVDQGHTVFLISWVNPDQSYADKTFDEYLIKGPIAALDAIEQATGEKEVNAIGYCIGGTLMGATLAYMAAKRDNRIVSCTYFTSMFDFSDPGEIGVFIDEAQIDLLEKHMRSKGFLEGHHLAEAFSMLRENDLIWSFFIKDYLLGQEPTPFDILYWNSDSTNMPAAMHSFYLRNMYLYNRMREPDGITLGGEGIDLRRITIPQYFLSASEDHIAPWKSTYAGTQLVAGPVRFVLGASGHIAGAMNPPAAKKYCYWTNDTIAIDCLEDIIRLSDGLMVARGDLGVEMRPEQVPIIQREILRASRHAGKPVIVATQMLESMISAPAPTRAEASDVATAVYDGADAVMLSAESAAGQYPVQAVSMMDSIIREVEHDPYSQIVNNAAHPEPSATISDAICCALRRVGGLLPVAAAVTYTSSGHTSLRAARERPAAPILSMTPSAAIARRLTLVWGVHSVLIEQVGSVDEVVRRACQTALDEDFAKKGDIIAITAGTPVGVSGTTNLLKLAIV
jgi:Pyruvate kinase, barrel domain/Pyruvate kinase, alpha/beta domain/Poly-beta-hydroxybutyrate polymerase (PhaC) N-terminus